MKISVNSPCSCHSGKKYKKCCQIYHKGAKPANAMLLMRSRYSAYALRFADYITGTTHPSNPDHVNDKAEWNNSILEFCDSARFTGLKITEFLDGDKEAFVTFEAKLGDTKIIEKSRFLKEEGRWLYESGIFL